MPYSTLLLTLSADSARGELFLPVPQLRQALSEETDFTEAGWLPAYLQRHLRVTGPDGLEWQVRVGVPRQATDEQNGAGAYEELIVDVRFLPPGNASPGQFDLYYDGIAHQLVTHKTVVRLADETGDTELAVIRVDPVTGTVPLLHVNVSRGNAWGGFRAMVSLGADHILAGADHLLFVFLLLLTAPLTVRGERWNGRAPLVTAVRRVLWLVSGFTLGHSLSLLAVTLGDVRLPERAVEVAIAATILFTAINALRPLILRGEVWMVVAFGLVHGLGFAGALADLELGVGGRLLNLLGFNIGIELVQLTLVALVLPWLLLLARDSLYGRFRYAAALFSAVAAAAWLLERATGGGSSVTAAMEAVFDRGLWLLLGIAVLTATSLLRRRYAPDG